MNRLDRTDVYLGLATGAFLHIILVLSRSFITRGECRNNDCTALVAFDVPVSLLYVAAEPSTIIYASLIIGTAYWAVMGVVGLYICKRISERFFGR